jgi:multidrug efflux system membrane fusion protein
MKINKNVKIAGIILGVVTAWMITGVFKSEEKVKDKIELKPVKVLAKTITAEQYTPEVQIVGRTEVSEEVDLVAEVTGKVDKINFKQGDFVKSGDLMLTLENDYRKDNLESAQEELKSAKLKLDIAENLAKQAYKAKTDLADRQAEYTRALSNLTDSKRAYENSFVNAPISGFVEERNVSLGDYVKEDTVLYKIISQDQMLLVGYLSQNQISQVRLGQKAYGIFNSGHRVDGEVTFIAQKADENTKTYKVEITVNKKGDKFRVIEGLTIQINIPTSKVSVYKVPHSSMIITDDGKVGIRAVNKDNVVEFYESTLIQDSHDYQLVTLKGANKQDLDLITRGQIDVQNGLTVEVSKSDVKPTSQTKEDK